MRPNSRLSQDFEDIQSKSPSRNLSSDNLIIADGIRISSDPFLWKLNEGTRDYIAMNGMPQNDTADFKSSNNVYSDKTRYCSKKYYFDAF